MVINLFTGTSIVLSILIFLCLYRAYVGPTCSDRVVAINVISTKIVSLIALVSFIYQEEYFLDVALVYALISFITVVGVAKYLEWGTC